MESTRASDVAASDGDECDPELLLSVVQVAAQDGHAPVSRLCASRHLQGPDGGVQVTLCAVEGRLKLTMEGVPARLQGSGKLFGSPQAENRMWDVPWDVSEIVGLGFLQLDKQQQQPNKKPSQDSQQTHWDTWDESGDSSHVESETEAEEPQSERRYAACSACWEDILVVAVHEGGALCLAHLGTFFEFWHREEDGTTETKRFDMNISLSLGYGTSGLIHAATDGKKHMGTLDTRGYVSLWEVNTESAMQQYLANSTAARNIELLGKGKYASVANHKMCRTDVIQMAVQKDKVAWTQQNGQVFVARFNPVRNKQLNVDESTRLDCTNKILQIVDIAPRLRWELGTKSDRFRGCIWESSSMRERLWSSILQSSKGSDAFLISSSNGKVALVRLLETSQSLQVLTVKTVNGEVFSLQTGKGRVIEAWNRCGCLVAKLKVRSRKQMERASVAYFARKVCCSVQETLDKTRHTILEALEKTERDLPLIAKSDREGSMVRSKVWRRANRRIALLKRRWLLETFAALNARTAQANVSSSIFDPMAFVAFCELCSSPNGIGNALLAMASLGEVQACGLLLQARGGSPRSSVAKALLALPPTIRSADLLRLAIKAPPHQSLDACEESPTIISRLHYLVEGGGACASEVRALICFSLALSRAVGLDVCEGVHSLWADWLKARIMAVEAATGDANLALEELRSCRAALEQEEAWKRESAGPEMDRLHRLLFMLKALRGPRDTSWICKSTYTTVLDVVQQVEQHRHLSGHEDGLAGQLFYSTNSHFQLWNLPLLEFAKMSSASMAMLQMCHGSDTCLHQAAAVLKYEATKFSGLQECFTKLVMPCSPETASWCGKALARLRMAMSSLQHENPSSVESSVCTGDNTAVSYANSFSLAIDVICEAIICALVQEPSKTGWENARLFAEEAWPQALKAHELQTIVQLGAALARIGVSLDFTAASKVQSNPTDALLFLEKLFMDETSPLASKWLQKWLDVAPVREICSKSDLQGVAEVFVKVGSQKSMELVELLVAKKSKSTSDLLSPHKEVALRVIRDILEDSPSTRARALVEAAQAITYSERATSDRLLHARSILRVVIDSVANQVDLGDELAFWCRLAKEEFNMLEGLCVILPKAGVHMSPSAWKDLQKTTKQQNKADNFARTFDSISILGSYVPKAGVDMLYPAACCLGLVSDSCSEAELAQAVRLYVSRRDNDAVAAAALAREGYAPAWELCMQLASEGKSQGARELLALAVGSCPISDLRHSLNALRSSYVDRHGIQQDLNRSDGPAAIALMKVCKEVSLGHAGAIHAHAAAMCAKYASEATPRSPLARARQHWALRVCALAAALMSAGETRSPNHKYQDLIYAAPEDAASLVQVGEVGVFSQCAQTLGTASTDSARARYEVASANAEAVRIERQVAARKLAEIGAQDRLKQVLPAELQPCLQSILHGSGAEVQSQRIAALSALATEGARLLVVDEDAACARILADAGEFASSWGLSTLNLCTNFGIEAARLQDCLSIDAVLSQIGGLLGDGDLNDWKICASVFAKDAWLEKSADACTFRFKLAAESALRANDMPLHDHWSQAVSLTDLCMALPAFRVSSILGVEIVPSRVNQALAKCKPVDLASQVVNLLRDFLSYDQEHLLDDLLLPDEVYQVHFWADMFGAGDKDVDLDVCVAKYDASKALLRKMDVNRMAEAVMVLIRRSPMPAKLAPLIPDCMELCRMSPSLTRAVLADAISLVAEHGKELPAYSKLANALWEEKAKALDRALKASNIGIARELLQEAGKASTPVGIEGHKDKPEDWLLSRPLALSKRLRSGGLARLSGSDHLGLSLVLEGLVSAEQKAGNKHAADVASAWLEASNVAPAGVDLRALSGGQLCADKVHDAQLACKEVFDKVSMENASIMTSMLELLCNANLPVPKPSCAHLSLAWKLVAEGAPVSSVMSILEQVEGWEKSAFSLAVTWSSSFACPQDASLRVSPEDPGKDVHDLDHACKELWFTAKSLDISLAASFLSMFFSQLLPASTNLETCATLLESFEGDEVCDAATVVRQKRIDLLLDKCDFAQRHEELDTLAILGGAAAALASEGEAIGVPYPRAPIPKLLATAEEACSALAIRMGVIAVDLWQYDAFVSPLWSGTGSLSVLDPGLVEGLPWMLQMRVYFDLLVRELALDRSEGVKDARTALRNAFLQGLDAALASCSGMPFLPISGQSGTSSVGENTANVSNSSEERLAINITVLSTTTSNIGLSASPDQGDLCPYYEEQMMHVLDTLFGGESTEQLNHALMESCKSVGAQEPHFASHLTNILSPYIHGKLGGMQAAVFALFLRSWVFDDAMAAKAAGGLAALYQLDPSLSPSTLLGEDTLAARASICSTALAHKEELRTILSASDSIGYDRVALRLGLLEEAFKQKTIKCHADETRQSTSKILNKLGSGYTTQNYISAPWRWLWEETVSIDPSAAGAWIERLLQERRGQPQLRLALANVYLSILEDKSVALFAGQLAKFLLVEDIAPCVAEACKDKVWKSLTQVDDSLSCWVLQCFEQGISLLDILAASSVIHETLPLEQLLIEYENFLQSNLKELEALAILHGGPRARAVAADAVLSRIQNLFMVLGDRGADDKESTAAKMEQTFPTIVVDYEELQNRLRSLAWDACEQASGPRGVLTRLQGMLSALLNGTLAGGTIQWQDFKSSSGQLQTTQQNSSVILQRTCSLAPPFLVQPTQDDVSNIESATAWFKQALQSTLEQGHLDDGLAALASILRIAWQYGEVWSCEHSTTSVEKSGGEQETAGKHSTSSWKVRPCVAHHAWICLLEASFEHVGVTMACAELDSALTMQSDTSGQIISLLDGKEQTRLLSLAWRRGNKDAALIMALLAPQGPLHKEAVKRALHLKKIAPEVLSLLAFRGVLGSLLASSQGETLATEAMERPSHDLGRAIVVAAATSDGYFAFAATEAIDAMGTHIMLVDEYSALVLLDSFLIEVSSQEKMHHYLAQVPQTRLNRAWQAILEALPDFVSRARRRLAESTTFEAG